MKPGSTSDVRGHVSWFSFFCACVFDGLFLQKLCLNSHPHGNRGRAVTTKERDVVRGMKEKERERRALQSHVAWPVSFDILLLDMVGLWKEGVPSFLLCHLVVFIVLRELSMR